MRRSVNSKLTALLALVCAGMALAVGAASASAARVVELGTGFPLSVNGSDQVLLGTDVPEENSETKEVEDNIRGPWAVYSTGKRTALEPLNGPEQLGTEPEKYLQLFAINEAGEVGGSATKTVVEQVGSESFESGKPVPAWFSPAGQGEYMNVLLGEYTVLESGQPKKRFAGGLGIGIDNAGEVAGFGAVRETVSGKEVPLPRGMIVGHTGPAQPVGEPDIPKPGGSEVFALNGKGEMAGETFHESIVKTEGGGEEAEETERHWFLWKHANEKGTPIGIENPRSIAEDGTVLGEKTKGKFELRLPEGKEEAVSGPGFEPYKVNSQHKVVGIETVEGKPHAAVWQSGTVTDLNSLLGPKSGWELTKAIAINDAGDIVGVGVHEGKEVGFLLKNALTVNSNGDEARTKGAAEGACATAKEGCTLRAAIETADSIAAPAPVTIDFAIPGGKAAELKPGKALPALTHAATIEGQSQQGAVTEEGSEGEGRTIGVTLNGEKAGAAPGLIAEQEPTSIEGIAFVHFSGPAVQLKGPGGTVADCVFAADFVGVEALGNGELVGSYAERPGNNFVAEGDLTKLHEQVSSGSTKKTPSQFASQAREAGAAVLVGGGSGSTVRGNTIGLAGTSAAAREAATVLTTYGMLVAPAAGSVSNLTIGGAARNTIAFSFDAIGLAAGGGNVASPTITNNKIGGARTPSEEEQRATLIGLLGYGPISGLHFGVEGAGNSVTDTVIGALLSGQELTGAALQANTIGAEVKLGGTGQGALHGHNVFGVVLAGTSGVAVGGAPPQGNRILGDLIGVTLAGKQATANRIESNTIGLATPPTQPFDLQGFDAGEFGGVIGILESGGEREQVIGNQVNANLFGIFSAETADDVVQGNTLRKDAFGLWSVGSGGLQLGGSAAGQGNTIDSAAIGALLDNFEPTESELKAANSGAEPVSAGVRERALGEGSGETEALNEGATVGAALGAQIFAAPSKPGTNNRIEGNTFGTNAAGESKAGGELLGNSLAALIGGDEHGVKFGGVGPGQGNTVTNSGSGGVMVFGSAAHSPSVSILGNAIFNNSTFGGAIEGVPGLGINLVRTAEGGPADPTYGLGINPQDPLQPDAGPNALLNAPVLTSATVVEGKLVLDGEVHAAPNSEYTMELFSDQFKNPYGAGEGQYLAGRATVKTDGTGSATFSLPLGSPPPPARYASATLTGGQEAATSEFALAIPIVAGPTGPGTGVHAAGTVSASSNGTTATLGSVTVSCASASPSPCSASASATEASGKASAARKTVIASWSARIAPGHSAVVKLKLTRAGRARLRRRHRLALLVRVSVSSPAGNQARTVHVRLRYRR